MNIISHRDSDTSSGAIQGLLERPEVDQARQLLIDVSVIVQSKAHTGIQRVVRAQLRALMNAKLNGYRVCPVIATRRGQYEYAPRDAVEMLGNHSLAYIPQHGPIIARKGDIFLGLDLAANILPRHRLQISRWRRLGCRVAIIMYDLLPELKPKWFNLRTRRNFRKWLRVVTSLSDDIICISEAVARDLRHWLSEWPWRGNKDLCLRSIRLGSDLGASVPTKGLPDDAEYNLRHFASRAMLLVVGTIEPRKGHQCLLAAFDQLWRECAASELTLVFVGRPGWKTDALQKRIRSHQEHGKRFFWFENASDEYLDRLYGVSRGVIIPSFGEGFGLPLVEAVAHGIPVLARDLAVFREMGLPDVTYFADDNPDMFAAAIMKWVSGNERGQGNAMEASRGPYKAVTWGDSLDDLLKCLGIGKQLPPADNPLGKEAAFGAG